MHSQVFVINLFHKHLVSAYSTSGIAVGAWDTLVNIIVKDRCPPFTTIPRVTLWTPGTNREAFIFTTMKILKLLIQMEGVSRVAASMRISSLYLFLHLNFTIT
jgi:hypothetical protein